MLPRYLRPATLVMASLFSLSAFAQVTVELPKNGEWVLVNGVNAPDAQSIVVENGQHQLAFRINTDYRQNGDITLYSSPVQIIKFSASDETISIDLPTIRNQNQARSFTRQPTFTLLNAEGNAIAFDTDMLKIEGLQLGRNYEAEIAQYNQGNGPASLKTAVAIANLPVGIEDNKQSAQTAENENLMAEEMLNFWWQKADEETKSRFKRSILEN